MHFLDTLPPYHNITKSFMTTKDLNLRFTYFFLQIFKWLKKQTLPTSNFSDVWIIIQIKIILIIITSSFQQKKIKKINKKRLMSQIKIILIVVTSSFQQMFFFVMLSGCFPFNKMIRNCFVLPTCIFRILFYFSKFFYFSKLF